MVNVADGKFGDLIWEDENHFRIHTRAYTDPDVFEVELGRIFGKAWIFVGHASQIPYPGDYRTAYIGKQPVIVSRGKDGEIHVLYNRCLHRGSVVCRSPQGNAKFFRCPYHGWVYGNDGGLIGVAMSDGYDDDFDKPTGLKRVPRVATYRGLIFASLAADGESLEDYLERGEPYKGSWKRTIDRKFDLSPVGEIEVLADPIVVTFRGNWKFQSENMIDGYHFMIVHEPLIKLQKEYGDETGDYGVHQGKSVKEMKDVREFGLWPDEDLDARLNGDWGDDVAEYYRLLIDKYDREYVRWLEGNSGGNSAMIYPSFGIIHHQLRVWRPISVDETEVTIYYYNLKGAPSSYNEGWLRSQERFYGPAGYGMPDDVEMFAINQQGLACSDVDWLILERGLRLERNSPEERPKFAHEAGLRSGWRIWREMMGKADAESAALRTKEAAEG
jgi:benzoate/toluate 1,2-dioxygenase alpha subunit